MDPSNETIMSEKQKFRIMIAIIFILTLINIGMSLFSINLVGNELEYFGYLSFPLINLIILDIPL